MPATELYCTLVSDGSSDRALIPILRWLLHYHLPECAIQLRWADLRQLPRPPRELYKRIAASLQIYPCDLLFVHRDAENASIHDRQTEIGDALAQAQAIHQGIGVIPVRMMEAWLLINEMAIRKAANNPNGRVNLDMPSLGEIENIANPKDVLHNLILRATELSPRRRNRFNTHSAVHRIPEYIEDFSSLRQLPAFQALEEEVVTTIAEQAWKG